jgi:hypothetical protein
LAGYAAQFYSDAQELTGAARIVVAAGQNAEANLALNLTKFYLVEASVARAPVDGNWQFTQTLLDHSGQELEYPIHQVKDHALCAYLPDGSYTLVVQASAEEGVPPQAGIAPAMGTSSGELVGSLEFSVDGQAARNLRVALAQGSSTPVHLRYEPGPPGPVKVEGPNGEFEELASDAEPLELSAVRVNALSQTAGARAGTTQTGEGAYQLETALPGAYWIQVTRSRPGVCEGAVTAGGQNLARTPWIAGSSGMGIPIDVVMRTDCAKLTVQMPAALLAENSGEGATLYVYAVPEFDSMEGAPESQVEQFGERTATIEDMAPGTYRVFAFRTPRSIEYRNPAALDRLGPGQNVTLAPGGKGNLVLEGISR